MRSYPKTVKNEKQHNPPIARSPHQRTTLTGNGAQKTQRANPYGSPVKIVGDNVTKKDYDDFWNAFHEESTGEKLNWAANQLQVKPKQQQTNVQSTPQNTRSRDMMHWAMNSSGNLATPQNPVLTNELRDIEAAEKGDANSEWYKRLEAAWEAGDLEAYEKVEREMKAQKERIDYILTNRGRTYDDNFVGQFGANYRAGRMSQDEALAWNEYYKSPTEENRAYAESISDTLEHFRKNNAETLADDATLPWVSQSLAGNLPQMMDQTKAGLAGAAGVGLTTGFLTAASGNPLVAGTAALNGAKLGYSAATAKQSYDVMRGATFKRLIEQGLDEETARAAANDEAVLSSLIEMADSGMDVKTAIDVVFNPKAAGVKGVLGILGKAGLNVAGEALEESLQEGISIANENRGGSGIFDLVKNAGITYGDALTRDGEARRRILEAGAEGAKLAAMTSAPGIIGGGAYKMHTDMPDVQVEADGRTKTADFENSQGNKLVKAISGARITDQESEEGISFAESYYEEIRHYSTDAQKISNNIGVSCEDVQKIKNYLFLDNSKYDDVLKRWVPFDPNCAIAHSWQRLMLGKDIKPHDRTLILHELYEMEIKEQNPNISHAEAHSIATKKYNYTKESDEYYANLEKYKNER